MDVQLRCFFQSVLEQQHPKRKILVMALRYTGGTSKI